MGSNNFGPSKSRYSGVAKPYHVSTVSASVVSRTTRLVSSGAKGAFDRMGHSSFKACKKQVLLSHKIMANSPAEDSENMATCFNANFLRKSPIVLGIPRKVSETCETTYDIHLCT